MPTSARGLRFLSVVILAAGLLVPPATVFAGQAAALFGLVSLDPRTVLAMGVVLGLTALVAGCLPARKAANLDPTTALRMP